MSGSLEALITRENYPILPNLMQWNEIKLNKIGSRSQFNDLVNSQNKKSRSIADDLKGKPMGRIIGEDPKSNWMIRNTYQKNDNTERQALSSVDSFSVPLINQLNGQLENDRWSALQREIRKNRTFYEFLPQRPDYQHVGLSSK
jgi:hypothetical protein